MLVICCCGRLRKEPWLQDAEVAKSLAFSQEVRTRCVTLQGDDFNPSGTLTGKHLLLVSAMWLRSAPGMHLHVHLHVCSPQAVLSRESRQLPP